MFQIRDVPLGVPPVGPGFAGVRLRERVPDGLHHNDGVVYVVPDVRVRLAMPLLVCVGLVALLSFCDGKRLDGVRHRHARGIRAGRSVEVAEPGFETQAVFEDHLGFRELGVVRRRGLEGVRVAVGPDEGGRLDLLTAHVLDQVPEDAVSGHDLDAIIPRTPLPATAARENRSEQRPEDQDRSPKKPRARPAPLASRQSPSQATYLSSRTAPTPHAAPSPPALNDIRLSQKGKVGPKTVVGTRGLPVGGGVTWHLLG